MPIEYNPDWLNQTPPPEGQIFNPATMTPSPEADNPPGIANATGEMFGPPIPAASEVSGPGTMTVQLQGQAPVTTRVRQIAPQPLPWWMAQQDEELRNQRIQEQARQEAQMQTNQAYVRAKQLEGQLGFAADIQAGVPMPTALAKWMPKIHAGNPASFAKSLSTAIPQMARLQPPPPITVQNVGGYDFARSGNSMIQLRPKTSPQGTAPIQEERQPGVPLSSKIRILTTQLSDINKQLDPISINMLPKEERAAKKAELESIKNKIVGELESYKAMPSTSTVKRWRTDENGKIVLK